MATFKSDKAQTGAPARYLHSGDVTEFVTYTTSAVLSAGDVVELCKVDAGARVVAIQLKATDTGMLVEVGDGLDPNRYLASITSDATLNIALANVGYEYTAADTIDLTIGTSATVTEAVVQAIVTVAYDGS